MKVAYRKLGDVSAEDFGQPALPEQACPKDRTTTPSEKKYLGRDFGLHAIAPKLIEECLGPLTRYIAEKRAERPTRNTGEDPLTPEVYKRLEGLSDERLALAVICGVIDATATPPKDDDDEDDEDDNASPERAAKEAIGETVEREWRGSHLQRHHERVAAKIDRAADHEKAMKDRLARENVYLKRNGIDLEWTKDERIKV